MINYNFKDIFNNILNINAELTDENIIYRDNVFYECYVPTLHHTLTFKINNKYIHLVNLINSVSYYSSNFKFKYIFFDIKEREIKYNTDYFEFNIIFI